MDVQSRVAQQYPTKRPGKPPYRIVLEESAMRNDGTVFTDHDVHRMLRINGIKNPEGEWFRCTVDQVKAAIIAVRDRPTERGEPLAGFQDAAGTGSGGREDGRLFRQLAQGEGNHDKPPHFLWNAKMRFGKTFAAYQLAKKMGWRKVLVLTFKPAVQSAWEEDLKCHVDFKGWQFIKPGGLTYEEAEQEEALRLLRLVSGLSGQEPEHRRHQDQERMGPYHQLGLRDSGRIPLRRVAREREGTV